MEKTLNRIQDRKMRSKLESSKNFEIFNNEKITPNFINLAKGFKSEASQLDLKREDGSDFQTRMKGRPMYATSIKNSTRNRNVILILMRIALKTFWGMKLLTPDWYKTVKSRQRFRKILRDL